MPGEKVLVVEDDIDVVKLVREALKTERYEVAAARDIFQAKSELRRGIPDILVLDVQLPDDTGINLLKELRQEPRTAALPVLLMTGSKRSVSDKVLGLKLGADDYLLKPFDVAEFLARVEALLRRAKGVAEPAETVQEGDLVADLAAHRATLKGRPLKLWPKEFLLLAVFLKAKNRLLTRQFLYEAIWQNPYEGNTRQVDFLVHRLRQKIGPYKDRIASVTGMGYRFDGR